MDQILLASDVPCLVISPECIETWPDRRQRRTLLVALDGSPLAEEVLPSAAQLADALAAELLLVRVVDSTDKVAEAEQYLWRVARSQATSGKPPRTLCEVGSAVETIKRTAQDEEADAISVATHGRTGLARLVAGSVTTAVVRDAPVPVLVVRPRMLAPPSTQ